MLKLDQAVENQQYKVSTICGDARFTSRITSVGLTVGTNLKVVRNPTKLPVLLYARDTMLALDKKEAGRIEVEVKE